MTRTLPLSVYEAAAEFTDPKLLSSFKDNLPEGSRFVFGKVVYDLIHMNPEARQAYAELIQKGIKIGFNPTIPPNVTKSVASGKRSYKLNIFRKEIKIPLGKATDTFELDSATKECTTVKNSVFRARKISNEFNDYYSKSIQLENFDAPVNELIEKYNKLTV
ncbi:hypothetical protein D4Q76_01910 [archaeon]|nr:MAG: hypothetical protein D4Q76_01910 [archaeon]